MDSKDWYWNTYLWSEHWRDFRQRYYTHFGKVVCAVCSQDGKLHLHHNTYTTLKREKFEDVTPLCERCHENVHRWLEVNQEKVESTPAAIQSLKSDTKPFVPKKKDRKKKKKSSDGQQRRRAYEIAMWQMGKRPGSRLEMKEWWKKIEKRKAKSAAKKGVKPNAN